MKFHPPLSKRGMGMMETMIAMGMLGFGVLLFAVTIKPSHEANRAKRKTYCTELASIKMNTLRSKGINGLINHMNANCASSCPCSETESNADLLSYEMDAEDFMNRLPLATRTTHYEIFNVRTLNIDCSKLTSDVGWANGFIYRLRVEVTYQDTDSEENVVTESCELSESYNPRAVTLISSTSTCSGLGDACIAHNECCASFYCDSATSLCANCKGGGSACIEDEECCGALTCQAGSCASP